MARDHEVLQKEIGALRHRLLELDDRAAREWLDTSPLIQETLTELSSALEELQVSEEELRVSHETLLAHQSELVAERQRYRDLFDFAPDAYLITDPSGNIREANQAALDLLKAREDQLRRKPLSVFLAEADRRAFHARLARLPEVERITDWELRLRPRLGPTIPAAATAAVIQDDAGRVEGVRWLIRDVTSRMLAAKQAEQLAAERVARAEAEAASRAKSEFLAVVSHELRTPLTAILGFTELLRMGVPEPIPATARAQVERIEGAGRHLLQLIDEVLTFSRLAAGREQVQTQELEVEALLREACELIQPLAERRGLSLHLRPPASATTLATDPGKLRQVLLNLLYNAVKFTREGEIRLEAEAQEDSIVIRVVDTGVGIAAENLERIFEPFWQVEQGTTRDVTGTGLGLAVSRGLVELLGGTIEATSTPGEGTVFSVRLPRTAA